MDELTRTLRDVQAEQRMGEELDDAAKLGPMADRTSPEDVPTIDRELPPVATPKPKGPSWRLQALMEWTPEAAQARRLTRSKGGRT